MELQDIQLNVGAKQGLDDSYWVSEKICRVYRYISHWYGHSHLTNLFFLRTPCCVAITQYLTTPWGMSRVGEIYNDIYEDRYT